jgi:TetR/AcrR family fatty acid metabolism transcriptional regulator
MAETDRREQIREAALRVFARKGYRNTVVEDVAEEAGVSKGTIYTYFDRKEELLGTVAQGLMAELEGREDAILESDRPPLEKIRALLHAFVDLVDRRKGFANVMLDIWGAGMRDPSRFGIDFAALYDEYRARLRTLLREAQEQGDVPADLTSVAPTVLIGAIEGVLLQWLLDPENVDFPEAADDIIDLLYDGIRADDTS